MCVSVHAVGMAIHKVKLTQNWVIIVFLKVLQDTKVNHYCAESSRKYVYLSDQMNTDVEFTKKDSIASCHGTFLAITKFYHSWERSVGQGAL